MPQRLLFDDRGDGNKYKLHMDGDWNLADLSRFPDLYNQVYTFMYSLEIIRIAEQSDSETARDEAKNFSQYFYRYPWAGGYSAVHFYNGLYKRIPIEHKPNIISISYASPGWIEIGALVGVAMNIKHIAKYLSETITIFDKAYTQIQKGMSERKILGIKTQARINQLKREDKLKELKVIADYHDKRNEMLRNLKYAKKEEIYNRDRLIDNLKFIAKDEHEFRFLLKDFDFVGESTQKMFDFLNIDYVEGKKDRTNKDRLITLEQLDNFTGSRLLTLKILLSLYRRFKGLKEFQDDGKVKL